MTTSYRFEQRCTEMKVGDTVQIKGQLTILTVEKVLLGSNNLYAPGITTVTCIWFSTTLELQRSTFDKRILEPYEPYEPTE